MKKKQDPDQIPLTGRPKTSWRLDRSSFKWKQKMGSVETWDLRFQKHK